MTQVETSKKLKDFVAMATLSVSHLSKSKYNIFISSAPDETKYDSMCWSKFKEESLFMAGVGAEEKCFLT